MNDSEEPFETPDDHFRLVLYVAGQSPKSLAAYSNLKRICEEHLEGKYTIEVIDVTKHPEIAIENQILALPTVIRKVPTPMRKLIGDLSNEDKTLVAMQIVPRGTA